MRATTLILLSATLLLFGCQHGRVQEEDCQQIVEEGRAAVLLCGRFKDPDAYETCVASANQLADLAYQLCRLGDAPTETPEEEEN